MKKSIQHFFFYALILWNLSCLAQSGVIWALHSDNFILEEAREMKKDFEAQSIKVGESLGPSSSIADFEAQISKSLKNGTTKSNELFVYLASHGCKGGVACDAGKILPTKI